MPKISPTGLETWMLTKFPHLAALDCSPAFTDEHGISFVIYPKEQYLGRDPKYMLVANGYGWELNDIREPYNTVRSVWTKEELRYIRSNKLIRPNREDIH